jgi:leucyl-tRNA---protein transferase
MRQLKHLIEPPRVCSYLPEQTASLEYRLMMDVSPLEYEVMLVRGWRRFGPIYFRPACVGCGECLSLRIPLARFSPTESQRRALRRSRRFEIRLGRPQVDEERLALYAAWHADREADRHWSPAPLDADDYFQQFAFPHPAAHEISFRDDGQLVALGLVDVTPQAWSLVYFFYHPRIARLSPGVANVMLGATLAKERGIPHVYLGYSVAGCASMAYKSGFRPHELLEGRPGPRETPCWRPAESPLHEW